MFSNVLLLQENPQLLKKQFEDAARKGTDSLAAVGEIKAVGVISETAQPLSGGSVS